MSDPQSTADDPRDYVEYEIDAENGQVVGCKFAGEGRQVEPLNGVAVFRPVTAALGTPKYELSMSRMAFQIKRAFERLTHT